jgi:hypothetical protein
MLLAIWVATICAVTYSTAEEKARSHSPHPTLGPMGTPKKPTFGITRANASVVDLTLRDVRDLCADLIELLSADEIQVRR